jgi:membrane protease YdiL (CAAX protease family)
VTVASSGPLIAAPDTPVGRLLSGSPAYRPATPWKPAPALLATAAIIVASMAAMALAMLLLGQPASGSAELGHRLWALAAMQAVAVVLTLLASGRSSGRLREVLALRRTPIGWRAYASAIVAMAVLQAALAGVQRFLLGHDLLTDVRPIVGIVTGSHWPLAAAVMAIGAPLSEELLFRGFLLGALAQSRLGFIGAALISTAAWSALHYGYSLMGLADVFANGLLFCWLLWRTGSLRVPLFCHAAYNGAIVLALLLVGLPAPA